MSDQSRHSARIVSITRSAWAFAFGAWLWVRMTRIPSARSTASNGTLDFDLGAVLFRSQPLELAVSTTTSGPRRPELPARRAIDWTTVFLILTAVVGTWAVGLLILTAAAVVQPAYLYSDQKAALKAAAATVVALLAVGQLYTMESARSHLPRAGIRVRQLMRMHRWGGRIALSLAVLTAYFCLTGFGAPTSPLRVAIHGIFGSTAFVAIALKLSMIRFRPRLAFRLAPWLGRYAALAFLMIWLSSAFAFYTGQL